MFNEICLKLKEIETFRGTAGKGPTSNHKSSLKWQSYNFAANLIDNTKYYWTSHLIGSEVKFEVKKIEK